MSVFASSAFGDPDTPRSPLSTTSSSMSMTTPSAGAWKVKVESPEADIDDLIAADAQVAPEKPIEEPEQEIQNMHFETANIELEIRANLSELGAHYQTEFRKQSRFNRSSVGCQTIDPPKLNVVALTSKLEDVRNSMGTVDSQLEMSKSNVQAEVERQVAEHLDLLRNPERVRMTEALRESDRRFEILRGACATIVADEIAKIRLTAQLLDVDGKGAGGVELQFQQYRRWAEATISSLRIAAGANAELEEWDEISTDGSRAATANVHPSLLHQSPLLGDTSHGITSSLREKRSKRHARLEALKNRDMGPPRVEPPPIASPSSTQPTPLLLPPVETADIEIQAVEETQDAECECSDLFDVIIDDAVARELRARPCKWCGGTTETNLQRIADEKARSETHKQEIETLGKQLQEEKQIALVAVAQAQGLAAKVAEREGEMTREMETFRKVSDLQMTNLMKQMEGKITAVNEEMALQEAKHRGEISQAKITMKWKDYTFKTRMEISKTKFKNELEATVKKMNAEIAAVEQKSRDAQRAMENEIAAKLSQIRAGEEMIRRKEELIAESMRLEQALQDKLKAVELKLEASSEEVARKEAEIFENKKMFADAMLAANSTAEKQKELENEILEKKKSLEEMDEHLTRIENMLAEKDAENNQLKFESGAAAQILDEIKTDLAKKNDKILEMEFSIEKLAGEVQVYQKKEADAIILKNSKVPCVRETQTEITEMVSVGCDALPPSESSPTKTEAVADAEAAPKTKTKTKTKSKRHSRTSVSPGPSAEIKSVGAAFGDLDSEDIPINLPPSLPLPPAGSLTPTESRSVYTPVSSGVFPNFVANFYDKHVQTDAVSTRSTATVTDQFDQFLRNVVQRALEEAEAERSEYGGKDLRDMSDRASSAFSASQSRYGRGDVGPTPPTFSKFESLPPTPARTPKPPSAQNPNTPRPVPTPIATPPVPTPPTGLPPPSPLLSSPVDASTPTLRKKKTFIKRQDSLRGRLPEAFMPAAGGVESVREELVFVENSPRRSLPSATPKGQLSQRAILTPRHPSPKSQTVNSSSYFQEGNDDNLLPESEHEAEREEEFESYKTYYNKSETPRSRSASVSRQHSPNSLPPLSENRKPWELATLDVSKILSQISNGSFQFPPAALPKNSKKISSSLEINKFSADIAPPTIFIFRTNKVDTENIPLLFSDGFRNDNISYSAQKRRNAATIKTFQSTGGGISSAASSQNKIFTDAGRQLDSSQSLAPDSRQTEPLDIKLLENNSPHVTSNGWNSQFKAQPKQSSLGAVPPPFLPSGKSKKFNRHSPDRSKGKDDSVSDIQTEIAQAYKLRILDKPPVPDDSPPGVKILYQKNAAKFDLATESSFSQQIVSSAGLPSHQVLFPHISHSSSGSQTHTRKKHIVVPNNHKPAAVARSRPPEGLPDFPLETFRSRDPERDGIASVLNASTSSYLSARGAMSMELN